MDRYVKSLKMLKDRPAGQTGRVILSGLAGLTVLLALAFAGGKTQQTLKLSLPGPVIGLAVLAGVFVLAERFHERTHRQAARHVVPVGRFLVSHMGLLFVPAGVGIITEVDVLRHAWLPILVAVLGSTFICLIATGWLMHRLAPSQEVSK